MRGDGNLSKKGVRGDGNLSEKKSERGRYAGIKGVRGDGTKKE